MFNLFQKKNFDSFCELDTAKQGFTFTMVPSQISCFFAFIILEIGTGHKKKWYVNFLHVHRRNVVKEEEKQIHGVEVAFHCSCLPYRISSFFLHSLF